MSKQVKRRVVDDIKQGLNEIIDFEEGRENINCSGKLYGFTYKKYDYKDYKRKWWKLWR